MGPELDVNFELDESRPEAQLIPEGYSRIMIWNPNGEAISAEFDAVVRGQQPRLAVKCITIHGSSILTSVWPVRLFPNLESAAIFGERIERIDELCELPNLTDVAIDTQGHRGPDLTPVALLSLQALGVAVAQNEDIQVLARLRPVISLSIVRWPLATLDAISHLSARQASFASGAMVSLQGLSFNGLDHVNLLRCARLTSAAGAQMASLYVCSCNQLAPNTLGAIEGLRRLVLADMPTISSLVFLKTCRTLDYLSIAATSVVAKDFRALIEHPRLSDVRIPLSEDDVRQIAKANHRLLIRNSTICYYRGELISRDEHSALSRERSDNDDYS